MFMGERLGERLLKGNLLWFYCICDKVGTENRCSNVLSWQKTVPARDLKNKQTNKQIKQTHEQKAKNRVPPFPKLTLRARAPKTRAASYVSKTCFLGSVHNCLFIYSFLDTRVPEHLRTKNKTYFKKCLQQTLLQLMEREENYVDVHP